MDDRLFQNRLLMWMTDYFRKVAYVDDRLFQNRLLMWMTDYFRIGCLCG